MIFFLIIFFGFLIVIEKQREKINVTLKAYQDTKKQLDTLQKEYDRLREKITQPRCHSCNAKLGDNWCADCARKATQ